jgi:hypothetical protein
MRGQTTGIVAGIIAIIIIVGGVWWYVAANPPAPAAPNDTASNTTEVDAVNQAVIGFGSQLQQVSLMASSSVVAAAVTHYYGPYVAPELLAQWTQGSSTSAIPGRLTSSPWPDHIDIASTAKNADGSYSVSGTVAERTSTGPADTYPITATVQNQNGRWLITSFQGYPEQ